MSKKPFAVSDTGPLISMFQSNTMKSPHEPSALLLTAEDAIQDAENLQQWFREPETNKSSIPLRLHVPFSALLEILDQLEPDNLRQVLHHAEKRLVSIT